MTPRNGHNSGPVLVALGGNLRSAHSPPHETLRLALSAMAQAGLTPEAVSRFYDTPCFPAGEGPDYVNAAARLRCEMAPDKVLAALHRIEATLGRVRGRRWAGRTLDLDLLACGSAVLPDAAAQTKWRGMSPAEQRTSQPDGLVLPHPRLQDRAFVLVPLAEVAGDWRHPLTGQSVDEMLALLPAAARSEPRPRVTPRSG